MIFILSCVTPVVTLVVMVLAGRKDPRAWVIGIAGQAVWVWLVILTKAWGLLPTTIALVVIYSKNLKAWRSDQAIESGAQQ